MPRINAAIVYAKRVDALIRYVCALFVTRAARRNQCVAASVVWQANVVRAWIEIVTVRCCCAASWIGHLIFAHMQRVACVSCTLVGVVTLAVRTTTPLDESIVAHVVGTCIDRANVTI